MKLFNKLKPKPKIYCGVCGAKLVPNDTVSGYDTETGEAIKPFLNRLRCPCNIHHTYGYDWYGY